MNEAELSITPLLNTSAKKRIAAIAVTTSSARHDLSARLTDWDDGHFYTFVADGGDVYVAFNNADAGSVDETATTTGVTECFVIKDGQRFDWQFVDDHKWLVVKGSAACELRISLSSRDFTAQTTQGGQI